MLSYTLSAVFALGAVVVSTNAQFSNGSSSVFASGHSNSTASRSPTNTINGPSATVFVPGSTDAYVPNVVNLSWDVSVVCADPSRTTYALVDHASVDNGMTAQTITVTQGPSDCRVAISTSIPDIKVSIENNCKLYGTTSADCLETYSASVSGSVTSATLTTSLDGYDIYSHFNVFPVTSGASFLATPTNLCKAEAKPGNAAAPTGVVGDVYKVIMVPAAAALAAAII